MAAAWTLVLVLVSARSVAADEQPSSCTASSAGTGKCASHGQSDVDDGTCMLQTRASVNRRTEDATDKDHAKMKVDRDTILREIRMHEEGKHGAARSLGAFKTMERELGQDPDYFPAAAEVTHQGDTVTLGSLTDGRPLVVFLAHRADCGVTSKNLVYLKETANQYPKVQFMIVAGYDRDHGFEDMKAANAAETNQLLVVVDTEKPRETTAATSCTDFSYCSSWFNAYGDQLCPLLKEIDYLRYCPVLCRQPGCVTEAAEEASSTWPFPEGCDAPSSTTTSGPSCKEESSTSTLICPCGRVWNAYGSAGGCSGGLSDWTVRSNAYMYDKCGKSYASFPSAEGTSDPGSLHSKILDPESYFAHMEEKGGNPQRGLDFEAKLKELSEIPDILELSPSA